MTKLIAILSAALFAAFSLTASPAVQADEYADRITNMDAVRRGA